MAQTAHASHPNYMAIFWWLLGLTIAELAAASISTGPAYPHGAKVFLLVGMALAGIALIARERRGASSVQGDRPEEP